jgi:hypothetical protein
MDSTYRRRKLFDDSDDDAEAANQGRAHFFKNIDDRVQPKWPD